MPRRFRLALLGILIAAAAGSLPALADIIHLKSGGTIHAESWEDRGETLVIHRRDGTIAIPRGDVAQIEREPPAPEGPEATAGPASIGAPAAGAGPPPLALPPIAVAPPLTLTKEEALHRLEGLRHRLRDTPGAGAKEVLPIVNLLKYLGLRAYRDRDLDQALALFLEASQLDAHDVSAHLGLAATYLALGQNTYARSVLERARLDHPEDPDLLAFLGDVHERQERPEEALTCWQKSVEIQPDPSLQARIEKLRREHRIDRGYERSEAPHFTLIYDGERIGPDLGPEIVDYLEQEFSALVTRFDYYPPEPITVIVYPARQFYEATQAESGIAGLFDGKIRVPSRGLQKLNQEARAVLLHELAHAFIAGKSRGTAPRWLHEGIAQLIAGKKTSRATGIDLAETYRERGAGPDWGTSFTYASALSFVEFLSETEGFSRLGDVLEAMGAGGTAEGAFASITRETLTNWHQAWGEALVQRYLH